MSLRALSIAQSNAVRPTRQSSARRVQLAACTGNKTLASIERACSRLSILQFANGPQRSMGHVPGAEKGNFLIRGRGRPTVNAGRAGGILSIPVK